MAAVLTQKYLSFQKSLNWRLYLFLSIPWTLFLLLRVPALIPSLYCSPTIQMHLFHGLPGECYWFTMPEVPRYGVAFWMHLACVIPAGLLAVLQFTPRIRHRYRRFHRIAGYVTTLCVLGATGSALVLADKAFGGDTALQTATLALAVTNTFSILKAVNLARRKDIAGHRAWMLRSWAYLGTILTMRPLIGVLSIVMSTVPGREQWVAMPCPEVRYIVQEAGPNATALLKNWPLCDPSSIAYQPDAVVAVLANGLGNVVEDTAAARSSFGPAQWCAMLIHVLAVEWYLNSTAGKSVPPAKKAI